jgi:hypothetical protein
VHTSLPVDSPEWEMPLVPFPYHILQFHIFTWVITLCNTYLHTHCLELMKFELGVISHGSMLSLGYLMKVMGLTLFEGLS